MNILEMTRQAIREEEDNLLVREVKDTLADVFRKNIRLWDGELFPLLKIQRKNQYQYLADLLTRAGYVCSVDQVGAYLSRTRAEMYSKRKGGKNEQR